MRLKNFYQDYLKNRRGHDSFSCFYDEETPSGKTLRHFIDEHEIKRGGLIAEADLASATIEETEGTHWGGPSFKLRIWHAKVDEAQAIIALDRLPKERPGGKGRFKLNDKGKGKTA